MKIKEIKRDIILVGCLFLAGLAIISAVILTSGKGNTVQVRINGQITAEYPLSENRTEILKGAGGTNTLVIENGEAYVSKADCPDEICIRTGKISRNGQTIICLPHKLVIEICGDNNNSSADIIAK